MLAEVETDPRCISSERATARQGDGREIRQVRMRGNGGSMSSIMNETLKKDWTEFEVECLPLEMLLAEYGVNISKDRIFIKIDTEGAEAMIVPALLSWVKGAPNINKPTVFLSMHSKADKAQRAQIAEFLNLFPFFAALPARNSRTLRPAYYDTGRCKAGVALHGNARGDVFTVEMVCEWCDYLLVADDARAKALCPDDTGVPRS
ncbi:hypothetical protein T484DRAFT_1851515 [Baffinella frigidus]|nr:hypothetical protein T484DRAFT_1851515 [Cryptophyta sp. CCMP2293]